MLRIVRTSLLLLTLPGLISPPPSVAQSPGYDLLVSSRATNSVKRYDGMSGEYLGDFVEPGAGGLGATQEVLLAPNGNLIVSGRANNAILEFHPKTGAYVGAYTTGYTLRDPTKMTWGPDGDLYVSQWAGSNTVARFDGATGQFVEEVTPSLDRPMQHAWDDEGTLYVAIFGSKEVRRFASGATAGEVFTSGWALQGPVNLWFDAAGSLNVVDWPAGRVERFEASTGNYDSPYIQGMTNPEGWAYGPDGRLYIADWTAQRVNAYDPETGGFLETFASGGGVGDPNSILFIERFPDFRVEISQSSLTVASGGSGQVQISITPDRDLPFDDAVELSCSALHPGATCTFDPPSVTPGESPATAVLAISAASSAGASSASLLAALLMAGMVAAAVRSAWRHIIDRAAIVLLAPFLLSCGGDGAPTRIEDQTVTRSVAVQATSGDVTHSASLSLTLTGVTP